MFDSFNIIRKLYILFNKKKVYKFVKFVGL